MLVAYMSFKMFLIKKLLKTRSWLSADPGCMQLMLSSVTVVSATDHPSQDEDVHTASWKARKSLHYSLWFPWETSVNILTLAGFNTAGHKQTRFLKGMRNSFLVWALMGQWCTAESAVPQKWKNCRWSNLGTLDCSNHEIMEFKMLLGMRKE